MSFNIAVFETASTPQKLSRVDKNSLKMYDHHSVLRMETTLNEPPIASLLAQRLGERVGRAR
jgi:hypothetical protein